MSREFTTFEASKLGKLLSQIDNLLVALHNKYPDIKQKVDVSSSAKKIAATESLIALLKKQLPLFDKGNIPGIKDVLRLNRFKTNLEKLPSALFHTPAHKFFLLLQSDLKKILLNFPDVSLQNYSNLKSSLKSLIRTEYEPSFNEFTLIQKEILFSDFEMLIDDINFEAFFERGKFKQDECISGILDAYEGLHLRAFYDKYEIKIDHPMLFDLVTAIYLLLDEVPEKLEPLLNFLNPEVLNAGFSGLNQLYEQNLPELREHLNKYIMEYFQNYASSVHVLAQNENTLQTQESILKDCESAFEQLNEFKEEYGILLQNDSPIEVTKETFTRIETAQERGSQLLEQLACFEKETQKNVARIFENNSSDHPLYPHLFIANDSVNKLYGVSTPQRYVEGIYQSCSRYVKETTSQLNKKRLEIQTQLQQLQSASRQQLIDEHEEVNQKAKEQVETIKKTYAETTIRVKPVVIENSIEFYSSQQADLVEKKEKCQLMQAQLKSLQEELATKELTPLPEKLSFVFRSLANDIEGIYQPIRNSIKQMQDKIDREIEELRRKEIETIRKLEKAKLIQAEAEVLKLADLDTFKVLLSNKKTECEQLISHFDNPVANVEKKIEPVVLSLREIEEEQTQIAKEQERILQQFKVLLNKIMESVALIDPASTHIFEDELKLDTVEPILRFIDRLFDKFQQNLDREDIHLVDQVNKINFKEEIPFNQIVALSGFKGIPQPIFYLLTILGAEDAYPKWLDFQERQRKFKRDYPDLVKKRVGEFAELLSKKLSDAQLDPDYQSDNSCAAYRQQKTVLLEIRQQLNELKVALNLTVKSADETVAKTEQLLVTLDLLKTEREQSRKKESEIKNIQTEIVLLQDIIELLTQNQQIKGFINGFNQTEEGLTTDELFSNQKISAEFFNGIKINYSQFSKKLGSVSESLSENPELQSYNEKLKHIEELSAFTAQEIDGCIASHYAPLIHQVTDEISVLKKESEELVQLLSASDKQQTFGSMHEISTTYRVFENKYAACKDKLAQITNDDTSELLATVQEDIGQASNVVLKGKSALTDGFLARFKEVNEQITTLRQNLMDLILSENSDKAEHIKGELGKIENIFSQIPVSYEEFEKDLQPDLLKPLQELNSNQSLLERELKNKQEAVEALNSRVSARQKLCENFSTAFDNYWEKRSYPVKDFISSTDRRDRQAFIFLTREWLNSFKISGRPKKLLVHLQNYFPGQKLQPLINRLILAVEIHQKTVPTDYSQLPEINRIITNDQIQSILEQLTKVNPDLVTQVSVLCEQIRAMEVYGQKISEQDSERGKVAIGLAKELNQRINEFLVINETALTENNLNPEILTTLKRSFKIHLHSQDDIMNQHRASWKPVIANILIALSTLGIATGIKLLCTKLGSEKRAMLFFHNTERMNTVNNVDEALKGVAAPAA